MTDHPVHTAVIGGGTMGVGIAGLMLGAGHAVTLVDIDQATVDRARQRIRRRLPGNTDAHTRLDIRVGVDRTPPTADLVIEAVPEDPALKRTVRATASRVAPDAVLATNTSSISITSLGHAVHRPDRFLGLHFFNPVGKSLLIEIVAGEHTAPAALDQPKAWCQKWRRTPVVVRDRPGFATSRLGVLIGIEAIRMVEAGVADPHDIDTAMVLGYRHPMGPLRLTDLVGLDVQLGIAEHLATELGDRFTPPRLLREKVAQGQLGRKTGQGFYSWTDNDDSPAGAGPDGK